VAHPIGIAPVTERRWHPCDSALLRQPLRANSVDQGRCPGCDQLASTAPTSAARQSSSPLAMQRVRPRLGHRQKFDPITPARTCGHSPMSTAATMSARFPIISPSGTLKDDREQIVDQIVDGGYIDNDGIFTAAELVLELRRFNLDPVVIRITNEPTETVSKPQPIDGFAAVLGTFMAFAPAGRLSTRLS